jgi:Zn-dependent metalloprotease
MFGRVGAVAVLVLTLLTLTLPAHAAPPDRQRPGEGGWDARQVRKTRLPKRDRDLAAQLPGRAKVAYHPATGRVRSLSGSASKPLSDGIAAVASGRRRLSSGDAREVARRFMGRFGPLFGLQSPDEELRVASIRKRSTATPAPSATPAAVAGGPGAGSDDATDTATSSGPGAGAVVRFQQLRGGVPVLGGEVIVQLSGTGEVLSATGEVLPSNSKARTKATISRAVARRTAAQWLAREAGRPASAATTDSEGLGLYDSRIMGGPALATPGARLVWQIDARLPRTTTLEADHRLVLIDARGGYVLTAIARIADGLDRRVCDFRNKPKADFRCSSPFTRTEGQAFVGIADVDAAYRLMGVVDDWFRTRFGRDGIDDMGSPMMASVRFCPASGCPWRNAQWDWAAQQATFGRGWARADDIVAHEFVHGILDHEARLYYHYQSGAINEALADIFGELVDLDYAGGRDTTWTKWKIGEDTPVGVFRDLKDPTRRGHPDRVRSPLWHSGSRDFGGVHRNNGVANKAAYLIASGGNFRDASIAGIGRTRMAQIFYAAMTTRLTSASDYLDLGDALNGACTDLAGSLGINFAHCKSVRDAVRATQMHLEPVKLPPRDAPVCATGERPVDVFFDDLEDADSGLWKKGRLAGKRTGWFYPPNPNDKPAWDGTWASSGELNLYAPDRGRRSDTFMKLTQRVALPDNAYLRFEHGYGFDRGTNKRFDGGLVEIKLDGGVWRGVNRFFTHGRYNGRIFRKGNNPLKGRRAFTANSRGYSSSRIDLSDFAGRRMKLRFRMGSDGSVGGFGWYIDDVRIYVCTADSDKPTGSLLIEDGAESTTVGQVSIGITSDDVSTWVTRLRISNSGVLKASGRLRHGLEMSIRDSLEWDLGDGAWGGTSDLGTKMVYAQVRDAAGNWSDVFSDAIELVAE